MLGDLVVGDAEHVQVLEGDTIYALASEAVDLRLTQGSGWTPEQYGEWLASVLARSHVRDDAGAG